MSSPLVSIITPTYRRHNLDAVQRMIRSVQTQTYPHWEHLICSDGEHEPRIQELAERSFADPRRRYLVTKVHHGGYGAAVRQEVMTDHARGEYLVFLDDDNIIFPDYLERLLTALRSATAGERFAICRLLHFGPVRAEVGAPPLYLDGEPRCFWIDTLQVMVEAEAMKSIGWVSNAYIADGLTFEELGRRYGFVRVRDCLAAHL